MSESTDTIITVQDPSHVTSEGMVQFLGVRNIINLCHHAADDESTKRRTGKVTIFEAFLQKYQNVSLQNQHPTSS